MILIISSGQDVHSREIQQLLDRKGHPWQMLDLGCFPARAGLSVQFDSGKYTGTLLESDKEVFDFARFGAVWWRRPQAFTMYPDVQGQVESSFAYNECFSAINGMWLLHDATWINHPVQDEVAARKVYQLKVATECGLTIPKTCVTNNAASARSFIESMGLGNVIFKSFSATEQAWRETRLLRQDEMEKLEDVKYAPVIFQECIHADVDLRITVVGDQVFPAAVYSQDTQYKVDYRMHYQEARIEPHILPEQLTRKLLAFMKRLGLVYGAIDMRRRPNGEYIFLEVNPAGQWLFMEQPTGMPISEALADKLIAFDEQQKAIPKKDVKKEEGVLV